MQRTSSARTSIYTYIHTNIQTYIQMSVDTLWRETRGRNLYSTTVLTPMQLCLFFFYSILYKILCSFYLFFQVRHRAFSQFLSSVSLAQHSRQSNLQQYVLQLVYVYILLRIKCGCIVQSFEETLCILYVSSRPLTSVDI